MKLRALQINQLRKFDQPVKVAGLADGLNLIAGPNEMGKSTLVTALWAALFERHRANTQAVRNLQPNMIEGAAPWVALDFEVAGAVHRIEKRFLRRPMACLILPDGKRIEGDEAETALQRLLGIEAAAASKVDPVAPGHWGIIWVAQTQSFQQPTFSTGARSALQTRLEAEFDALTGRVASEALIKMIDASLYDLIDRRLGRPKGRYRELDEELAKVARTISELEQAELELQAEIRELHARQERLQERQREQTAAREEAELERLQARRQSLTELAAALREAEASVQLARYELDRLETAMHRREHLAEQIQQMQIAKAEAEADEATASAAGEQVTSGLEGRRRKIKRLDAQRAKVDQVLKCLAQLQRVIDQRDRCKAALEAVATELQVAIRPAALARVQIDGEPIGEARRVIKVVEPIDVQIEQIGEFKLLPFLPDAPRLRRQQQAAEQAIQRLVKDLSAIGGKAIADAAVADIQASTVEAMIGAAEERLNHVVTESERLRRQIEQLHDKNQAHQIAQEQARLRLAHSSTELQRLCEDRDTLPSTDLNPEIGATRRSLASAIQLRDRLKDQLAGEVAEELRTLEQQDAALRTAIDDRTQAIHELQLAIEGLRTKVQLRAGEGFGERIDQARRQQAELARQRVKYERDVAALTLLRATLQTAEQEARDHYLRPVIDRIQPYVQMLLPDAELTVDNDFRVTTIQRGTTSGENFDQLSDGTKEQIAVLARLAFAEMLHDQGLPALVILDDALVFADDQRLQTMFKALERAAEKVQILVLTCRERRFAELAAKRVRIELEQPAMVLRSAAR